ncbi:hypothetical protein MXB_1135, partial [Myxobolus squamalis]
MGITRKQLVKIVECKNDASTISLRRNFAVQFRNKERKLTVPHHYLSKNYFADSLRKIYFFIVYHFYKSKLVDGAYNSILLVIFLNKYLAKNVFKYKYIDLMNNSWFYTTPIISKFFREHSAHITTNVHDQPIQTFKSVFCRSDSKTEHR